MFWSVLAMVYGVFVAAFPRTAIGYCSRILLVGYDNPEDLEPSAWFVSLARLEGALLFVAGAATLAIRLATRGRKSD